MQQAQTQGLLGAEAALLLLPRAALCGHGHRCCDRVQLGSRARCSCEGVVSASLGSAACAYTPRHQPPCAALLRLCVVPEGLSQAGHADSAGSASGA